MRRLETPGVGIEPTTSRLTAERICLIELPRTVLCLRATPDKVAASGDFDDTCLHLRVAVGAKQNALCSLPPDYLERPSDAASGEPELLFLAVAMVKLERADPPVVPADLAATAGLPDEDLLQPAPPTRHGFRATSEATVRAPGLEPELRKTVAGALHQLAIRVDASDAPRVLSPGAVRAQAVFAEPMPNTPNTRSGIGRKP
jgi:hypothetical protein